MAQINYTEQNTRILEKIEELIAVSPSNWADLVSGMMGKSVSSVRCYARGTKGLRKGRHVEVLKHLNMIMEKQKKEIEKELTP